MGIYLNPGNEGFQSALNSQIYVDKTGILEYTNSVLDSEQRYICVSRPRRFGKSITAEMLVAYYDKSCDSSVLFQNLKISGARDYAAHRNKYDVIHIDVNSFRGRANRASEMVVSMQRKIIAELEESYPEAFSEKIEQLSFALSQVHKVYKTKFVVIIDEWDAVFRESKDDTEAQKEYIAFLRSMFKDAPAKKFIKLAYMTGILPIKKYGTESALNNFDEFTMLEADVLAEYVGFTEAEARNLYAQYSMDFEQAQQWYDGYVLGREIHIYNPKSVVDSIRRKRIGNYWVSTETYESLKSYISMNFDGLKDDITQMLAGGTCKVNPAKFQNDMTSFRSKDDILTLLIHLGYLTYEESSQTVSIPNEEVRSEFVNAIEDAGWEYVIKAIRASDELLEATLRGDEQAVAEGIEAVHLSNTSILNYNDENSLSCIITLAYYKAMDDYVLIRELPTGKGYADIAFIPKRTSDKPAMIVELKWDKSADGAIGQIERNQYTETLKEYKGNILLVGINYDKKTKRHVCRIEKA